jgi:hypothetical protein
MYFSTTNAIASTEAMIIIITKIGAISKKQKYVKYLLKESATDTFHKNNQKEKMKSIKRIVSV